MPKKLSRPFEEGQPGKVYSVCYPEPKTGHDVIKQTNIQYSSKSYQFLERYPELFEKTEEGIISKIQPIIEALEDDLHDIGLQLTVHEKNDLEAFLDNEWRTSYGISLKELNSFAIDKGPYYFFQYAVGGSHMFSESTDIPWQDINLEEVEPVISEFIQNFEPSDHEMSQLARKEGKQLFMTLLYNVKSVIVLRQSLLEKLKQLPVAQYVILDSENISFLKSMQSQARELTSSPNEPADRLESTIIEQLERLSEMGEDERLKEIRNTINILLNN